MHAPTSIRVPRLVLVALVAVGGRIAAADDAASPGYQTVVTGTRSDEPLDDVPIATEVIGRAELEASGADTVAEALEAHPGLAVERGRAGEILSVQGLGPEYTLVLVDGQRVIGRIDGGLDLTRLPITDVERIEIVKGPASALYGSDAIGGVINIITRRAHRGLEAEALASYGSFGVFEGRARASGGVGILRLGGSLGWERGDGWDLDPRDVATTASAYDTYHAGLELRLRPQDSSFRADATVRWLLRDQRGVDRSPPYAVLDRRSLSETFDATLAPEWKPSLPTRLRLSAHLGSFRDQFSSDQRGADALDRYQDTRELLLESSAQLDWLVGAHMTSFGLDGMYERLRSDRLGNGEGQRARAAVFVQDEWRLPTTQTLVLVPALRLDQDTRFGTHVTPRLALRWDPVSKVVLRASGGYGYRAPDFKQLYLFFENPGVGYIVEGNPDLAPETSRSVNLSAEWKPVTAVWLSAGVFRHDLENLILAELVDEGGPGMPQRFTYVNVASGTSQGVELGARYAPWTTLRLEASYAFTDARDDETDTRLEGRASHRATFGAVFTPRRSGVELSARGSVVGPRPFDVDDDGDGMLEDLETDPYATIDARIAWRFAGRFRAFVGVDNLLDAGDARFNPLQPRAFQAGASASY